MGRRIIFAILTLIIHEHGRPFNLQVSSSTSIFSVFKFPSERYFTTMVRFTHSFSFVSILSLLSMALFAWFFSSVSHYLFVVTLMNVFINSKVFVFENLWSDMFRMKSSSIMNVSTFSFLFLSLQFWYYISFKSERLRSRL